MNNAIHLAGNYRLAELPALSTITPGMIVETVPNGSSVTPNVQPHSTAGGFAELAIAAEDALQGRTTADNYVAGDPVQIHYVVPGAKYLLLLSPGHNYVIGSKLISNGDGTFKLTTGSPVQTLATVLQAINLSASGAIATLVPCRINP